MDVKNASTPGSLGRGSRIKGGCVHLPPGKSVGRHSNGMSEEFVLVLEGEAVLEAGLSSALIKQGEIAFIPSQTIHDMSNKSARDLVYVYFVGDKGEGDMGRMGEPKKPSAKSHPKSHLIR